MIIHDSSYDKVILLIDIPKAWNCTSSKRQAWNLYGWGP